MIDDDLQVYSQGAEKQARTGHHHQERTPDWPGHSCLRKSSPRISVLRSMPGRLKANVTWLQVGLNSSSPGMYRASFPPFSIFSNHVVGCWWRHKEHGNDPFLGQHTLYDQTSEADGNGWSRTEVDNLCDASLLRWTHAYCIGYGSCQCWSLHCLPLMRVSPASWMGLETAIDESVPCILDGAGDCHRWECPLHPGWAIAIEAERNCLKFAKASLTWRHNRALSSLRLFRLPNADDQLSTVPCTLYPVSYIHQFYQPAGSHASCLSGLRSLILRTD